MIRTSYRTPRWNYRIHTHILQTAVAIADAAAVSQALQPAQPAAQPAVPAAAVAGPAQNPAFAASMAAIKARLLAYLSAPGHQVKVPLLPYLQYTSPPDTDHTVFASPSLRSYSNPPKY